MLPSIAESDCIIIAGDDPIEMRLDWRHVVTPHQKVIDITSVGNIHYKHQLFKNNVGVEFPGSDFTRIAEAMGGAGVTCVDRESLNDAIEATFLKDTFTLISAVIGRNAYDGRI